MSTQAQVNPFFVPTQVSGCQLWLDAADHSTITLSGSNVTRWNDKSGLTNNASATAGSVTYASQSRSLVFNGSSYLSVPSNTFPTGNTDYSMFIISSSGLANFYWIVAAGVAVAGQVIGCVYYPDGRIENGWWTANIQTPIGSVQANVVTMLECIYLSPTLTTFINGTSRASSSSLGTRNNPSGPNLIGARPDSSPGSVIQGLVGSINEILVFGGLSTTQRQQVEGYLAWKWGLQGSLPATHPYKNSVIPPLSNPPTALPSLIQNPSVNVWFPSQISGLNLWLDAQDPNANGIPPANAANLTAWNDKSPSRFRLTSSGSAYSTTAVNRLPGINIGTNFFGFDPGSPQNNWQEVFAVGLWTGGSTFNTFNGFVTSSVDSDGGSGGGIILVGRSGTTVWDPSSYDIPWLNGTQTNTFLPTGAQPFVIRRNSSSSVNLRGIRFGVDRSNGRPWVGFISEVLCYNTSLTLSQRQQIEGYLAWKWALVPLLPSTHPYKTIVPSLAPVSVSGVSRGSINVWSPTLIPGCQLWLDAADATTLFQNTSATTPVTIDGQTIGCWKDKSVNRYSFIQTITANQPTYKNSILNGKSITRWNGTSSGLQSSTTLPFYTSASSGGSFFFVFMITNNSTQRFLMTYQNQNSGVFCVSESEIGCPTGNVDTGNFGIHQGCSKANVALNQITTNTYFLMNLNLLSSGVAPANTTIFRNGISSSMTAQTGGFYSGTTYPHTNNSRYLNIGYRAPFGGTIDCWLPGDIAEIIWYQNPLGTIQRQQIEGYLAWKWGLVGSLPATHPYKRWPPPPS
jgi:hypothetical protein